MRKSWMKPKLIILVKGTTDERVLTACKTHYAGSPKGVPEQKGCQYNLELCGDCYTWKK